MNKKVHQKNRKQFKEMPKTRTGLMFGVLIFLSALVVLLLDSPSKAELSPELTIYNWEDYLGPAEVIEDFEKEFGVKVNLETFEDDSIMYEKVKKNPDKYDLVVTYDYYLQKMISDGMLAEISKKNIPNLKNINKKFLDRKYDPGNQFGVPYLWGTTGLMINTKYIPEGTDSWDVLWDRAYAGKIAVLNNEEEVIGMALKNIGLPLVPQNEYQLYKAQRFLFYQQPLIRGYEDVTTIRNSLISEELWAAQIYNDDAGYAMQRNENLKYIIPKEGGAKWVDHFVIPAAARHKYTAEVFINYILRPDISAEIANYQRGATCNQAAEALLDQDLIEDRTLYPPEKTLRFLESFSDTEMTQEIAELRNKIWKKLNL